MDNIAFAFLVKFEVEFKNAARPFLQKLPQTSNIDPICVYGCRHFITNRFTERNIFLHILRDKIENNSNR